MSAIINKVEEVGKDDLERIFTEGDSRGVGKEIRKV